MAKKSEIKVYLPERLVGELEGRRRMGHRSKFIQEAIQHHLSKTSQISPIDFGDVHMLCTVRDRHQTSPMIHDLLQIVINEVNKK